MIPKCSLTFRFTIYLRYDHAFWLSERITPAQPRAHMLVLLMPFSLAVNLCVNAKLVTLTTRLLSTVYRCWRRLCCVDSPHPNADVFFTVAHTLRSVLLHDYFPSHSRRHMSGAVLHSRIAGTLTNKTFRVLGLSFVWISFCVFVVRRCLPTLVVQPFDAPLTSTVRAWLAMPVTSGVDQTCARWNFLS